MTIILIASLVSVNLEHLLTVFCICVIATIVEYFDHKY